MAGASIEITRFLEWAETDAAGHQHYTSAFRWVEECEAALYRSVGLPSTLFGQIPRVSVQMNISDEYISVKKLRPDLKSHGSVTHLPN